MCTLGFGVRQQSGFPRQVCGSTPDYFASWIACRPARAFHRTVQSSPGTRASADVMVLTVIQSELDAARRALAIGAAGREKVDDTVDFRGTVTARIARTRRPRRSASMGGAGSPPSASCWRGPTPSSSAPADRSVGDRPHRPPQPLTIKAPSAASSPGTAAETWPWYQRARATLRRADGTSQTWTVTGQGCVRWSLLAGG